MSNLGLKIFDSEKVADIIKGDAECYPKAFEIVMNIVHTDFQEDLVLLQPCRSNPKATNNELDFFPQENWDKLQQTPIEIRHLEANVTQICYMDSVFAALQAEDITMVYGHRKYFEDEEQHAA